MLKIGCVSTHPDDASFFSTEAARQWALHNPQWEIRLFSNMIDASSADVLLLLVNDINKRLSTLDLDACTWIMLSSRKADAYKAWQLGAASFLLRPFSLPDLEQALERAALTWYSRQGKLPPPPGQILELQLTKGRRFPVQCKDILYLEAQGEMTRVYLAVPGQERLTATRNLGYWEQQISGSAFIRSHKKFLVNIRHVSALQPGEIQIADYRLPIAKRRRKEVESRILSHKKIHGNPVNTLLSEKVAPLVADF